MKLHVITYTRRSTGQVCHRTCAPNVGTVEVAEFERGNGYSVRFPGETERDVEAREFTRAAA